MKRNGFTIVEMMVVVGILAILATIVTTAASASIKQARGRRADSMRATIEAGINTYYAEMGEWPTGISADDGQDHTYTGSACDTIIGNVVKASVEESNGAKPFLDASGLFVADKSKVSEKGCLDNHNKSGNSSSRCSNPRQCVNGLDFQLAYRGDKSQRINAMSISQMSFGYPGYEYGKFCRFKITYRAATDSVKVEKTTK